MAKWSEGHVAAICPLNLNFVIFYRVWLNWRPGGALGGCSPRLCRLRIDGLTPVSKYSMYRSHIGDMGPISLIAVRQQMIDFAPTASMTVLREKLGTNL
jgi:hypothetical protein